MESLIHKLKNGSPLQSEEREFLIDMVKSSEGDETAFGDLFEHSRQLAERVKELQCLYAIMNRIQNSREENDPFYQEIVDLIPPGFQYPKLTSATLFISEKRYRSGNDRPEDLVLSIPITCKEKEVGTLSVYFDRFKENNLQPRLLEEEKVMAASIADLIRGFLDRIEADRDARRNRQLIEAITQQTEAAVWIRDREGRHILANEEWIKIFQLENQNVVGKTSRELFEAPLAKQFCENDRAVRESGQPIVFEEVVETPHGIREYITHIFPIKGVPGLTGAVGGIATDVTQRNRDTRKLKETEEKLRTIVEHSTNLFYTHTIDHEITYISPQSEEFFGYKPEEARKRWTEFTTDNPVNLEGIKITEKAIDTGKRQPPYELELQRKDGSTVWVEVHETPIMEEGKVVGIAGSLTDITEQKLARDELQESLREKDTLLAEIHHRVKNNLAVISGMLYLQAVEEDEASKVTLKLMDSVTRIKAMAQIHEQLYQSKSFSKLNYAENLKELVTGIFNTLQSSVTFSTQFHCKNIYLNINLALPASLIVNEVVTNIMKHAYRDRSSGEVQVKLSEQDGRVTLQIQDDGVGLPENFMKEQKQGLGLHLIQLLSDQINATFGYENLEEGSRFTLRFDK